MSKENTLDDIKNFVESYVENSLKTRADNIVQKMTHRLVNSNTIQFTSAKIHDIDSEAYVDGKTVTFKIAMTLELQDPKDLLERLNHGLNRTLAQMATDVNPELETTGDVNSKFFIVHQSGNRVTFEFSTSVETW